MGFFCRVVSVTGGVSSVFCAFKMIVQTLDEVINSALKDDNIDIMQFE
jgi:ethanolamine utilization microcompartment shell protein EutS